MADAVVTARIVPSGVAADITAMEVDWEALVDTAVVDPGADLVVSIDVTHSEAADADGSAAQGVIEAAAVTVGDCEIMDIRIESDPVLSAPANVALDISDADTETIIWTPTFSQDADIVSAVLTSPDLDAVSVPYSIVRGNPQGHASQVSAHGQVIASVGPAPTGAEVGSPHDLILTVTDSNGRTGADTVAVTVAA